MPLRSFLRNVLAAKPARRGPARREALGLQLLESRVMPAIALVGTQLRVTGSNFNDAVTITPQVGPGADVVTQIVARRTESRVTPLGVVPFVETRTFNISAVASIRVELFNGANSFSSTSVLPTTVIGGTGSDVFSGGGGNDVLIGGGGNDTLRGNFGNDALYGQDGVDNLQGGDGNDTLDGGTGNDVISGGNGNDSAWGQAGDDFITGGLGNDLLRGGDGDDRLRGNDGNDTLWGNLGRDHLVGGNGTDTLYGGGGIDRIIALDAAADRVFGSDAVANTERDEIWVNSADVAPNGAVLTGTPDAARAVNVVTAYRTYTVNGVARSVGLAADIGDIVDPAVQDAFAGAAKKNFRDQPLFGASGLAYDDVRQGAIGSCYFLARMSSLARAYPQAIRDMVTDLGDGTYAVRFYNANGTKAFVRVDGELYVNAAGTPINAKLTRDGANWVAIVEKAWAVMRTGVADYDVIDSGGSSSVALDTALNLNNNTITRQAAPTGLQFVTQIKDLLNAGRAVVLGGPGTMTDATPMTAVNFDRGAHIRMVHSVQVDAQGVPTSIKFYDLYDLQGGLVTMTNFDVLRYCSSGAAGLWPK